MFYYCCLEFEEKREGWNICEIWHFTNKSQVKKILSTSSEKDQHFPFSSLAPFFVIILQDHINDMNIYGDQISEKKGKMKEMFPQLARIALYWRIFVFVFAQF